MRRREFLAHTGAALAISLSGCTLSDDDSTIAVTSQDPVDHAMLDLHAEVTDATRTETPPQVRVTLTNTGDEIIHVGTGHREVFSGTKNAQPPTKLWLLREDEWSEQMLDAPDCWRITGQLLQPEITETTSLRPDESASVDLYVFGSDKATAEDCIPAGDFRVESEYRPELTDDGENSFTWGFTLSIPE